MNYLQVWFVIIAGLLGLGIPFLFLGLELPNAMQSAIMNEAAEYVILDEEDENFWAEIPGRMTINNTKSFYIYECNNPEEVAARGEKPKFTEVGPFIYSYSHNLSNRKYSDENGAKNGKVSYIKKFNHNYIGDPKLLNKVYRVLNMAGIKKWQAVKNKARFQTAIEGFFELFFYARNNLLRDLVIKELVKHYQQVDPIYDLTNGLNVKRDVTTALAYDHYYGLLIEKNIYEWTVMCDTYEPYIEHEIMTYFGFEIPIFEIVRFRFCDYYLTKKDELNATYCKSLTYCSGYNLTFNQWMYTNIVPGGRTYKDITLKPVYGLFEFPLFIKEFMNKLNPDYKEQFANVKWATSGLHHLLDTLYEYPDYKTDEASLLLFDNMRRLFEAGKLTQNPFKMTGNAQNAGILDLSKFERIAQKVKLTKEQAFMMYCYFDYFINNTVLLQPLGGDLQKERVAHHGAHSLWDIASYSYDYLDVVLYSRAIVFTHKIQTCEEGVEYFFKINETENFMEMLKIAICNNFYFDTNIMSPVGWKYFIEASAFPKRYYYHRLLDYLNRTIDGFLNETLDAMLFKGHSKYYTTLENIKAKVKTHYQKYSGNTACENNFSPFCSKRQLFMTQFYDAVITQFPYPDSQMPASTTIGDWWTIIKPYMDWTISSPHQAPSLNDPTPLPDQEIEVPIEMPFLKRWYGNTAINKKDLYDCFHGYGLYDTDFLFNVFLKIRDPSKLDTCQIFASSFFFNTTRYFIRNVEFGPLFDELNGESVFFGYYNTYIEIEHILVDYLNGDDCTVNAWIGYNPRYWETSEKTFEHLKNPNIMLTGSQNNNEIRKYKTFYGRPTVTYRRPIFDESGDQCPFDHASPFTVPIDVSASTDGLQFEQYPGKTPPDDTKLFLDWYSLRPLKLGRINDKEHYYKDLLVNNYVVDFLTNYGCEKGVYIRNGLDMTSFFQVKSITSKAQFSDIEEPGLIKPVVKYIRPLDLEPPPEDIQPKDSYFIIEPYTGITLKYEKKLMTSVVLYYDELYDKLPEGGLGELLPYYSTFDYYKVHDGFVGGMEERIRQAVNARKAAMIAFTIIGFLLVFSALGMVTRSFFFKPNVSSQPTGKTDEPLLKTLEKPEIKVEKPVITPPAEDLTKENKDAKEEDLQKDIKEEKKDEKQP